MADKPPSASDYLAQAAQQARIAPRSVAAGGVPFNKSTQARHNANDPLSWLIDILTRPLSGVTNVVQSAIDAGVDSNQSFMAGKGVDPGQIIGALPPIAFLTGLLSTDPEKHRTFSDVIEQSTDKFGSYDPNYKNTLDNVNPVLKGTLGFVGDVALDPLMWIPGAQVLKGAGLVAKGVKLGAEALKAGTSALKEGVTGTRVLTEAEKAASAAARAGAAVEKPTYEGGALKALMDDPDLRARVLTDPKMRARWEGTLADVSRREIAAKASSGTGQQLGKVLDMIKPREARPPRQFEKVPQTLGEAKPVPWGGVGASMEKGAKRETGFTVGEDSWLGQAAKLIATEPEVSKNIPGFANAVKRATQGDPAALDKLRTWHNDTYLPRFATAKAQGKYVDVLGRETEFVPKMPEPAKLLSALQVFKAMRSNDDAHVEAMLGTKLVGALARYANPSSFDKSLSELRGVLAGSIDVPEMRKLSAPVKAMLDRLGVRMDALPVNVRKPQAVMNTEPVAPTVSEQLAKMVGTETDPEVLDVATRGMQTVAAEDLIKRNVKATHPYRTKEGVYRTEDQFGAGTGRILKQANTYFQWNLGKSATRHFSTEAGARKLFGMRRAAWMSEKVRETVRLEERGFDSLGVPFVVGVGDEVVPLSQSQVWDLLHALSPQTTYRTIWNGGTHVAETNLMDAAYIAVKDGDRTAIETAIRNTKTRYNSDGRLENLPNPIVNGGKIGKEALVGDQLVAELTDLIVEATPRLKQVVALNTEAFQARRLAETGMISDNVLEEVERLFSSDEGFGDVLRAIDNVSTRVEKIAEDFGATQDAAVLSNTLIKASIPAEDQAIAKTAVATEKVLTDTKTAVAVAEKEAAVEAQKGFEEQVKITMADEPFDASGSVRDLGDQFVVQNASGILSKVRPVFSRTGGMDKTVAHELRKDENTYSFLVGTYARRLNNLSKLHIPQEQLASLLRTARNGGTVEGQEEVVGELRHLWALMFGVGSEKGALIANGFLRNGNNMEHVNELLQRTFHGRSPYVFDMELGAETAKANGTTLFEELSKQVDTWELDDPIEQLYGIYKSFVDVQVQHTIAQGFLKTVRDIPGASSVTPKAGFSRVVNDSGKSIFAKYLPENLYIEDNILDSMHQVDNLMQQTMELKGPLGKFIRETYQPFLQAWKYGMTLPNPTHQVRNAISDGSLQYLALGGRHFGQSQKDSLKALASHNSYSNFDAQRMLQGIEELPDTGKVIIKGKRPGWELTPNSLYAAAADRGNLMTYETLEQLNLAGDASEGSGALANIWRKAQHSKALTTIGRASEARDHYSRLAHFSQFVRQGIDDPKYKSFDDLLDAASWSTRKHHPDGTDMTRAEQYFRLIIPFYSWQRKAIPLILEGLLTHPGRILLFPKAQYNLAVASGVHPDSLSDPFPTDQLFPSYLTKDISGPQFKIDGGYYGINPGFAGNDILNDYFQPEWWRSILGSTSPFIRAPFEFAAGGNVGTGARINDFSDFVDQNIPGVGQASRITGNSVTGSLVSMLQGGGLDPQFQVAAGNKVPGVSALNWLTGVGLTPMSQPNQINYAEIEKRNSAGQQRGF